MAIATIRLDDKTKERYDSYNPKNPTGALEAQLERFKEFNPSEKVVVLRPEVRTAVEKLIGPIDQEKLPGLLKSLIEIKFGDLKVALKPEQISRLLADAKNYRRDPKELLGERLSNFISLVLG